MRYSPTTPGGHVTSRTNAIFKSISLPERNQPRETIGVSCVMKGVARCPAILVAGRMEARASFGRGEVRATPRNVFRVPCDDYRWDCFETREGPTRGQSANRAYQLASSWSRDDHEDGGPTIQLPAAEARRTLRSLSSAQYTR